MTIFFSVSICGGASAMAEERQVTVPCSVESYYQTGIVSRIDGYVGKVNVDLGDVVKLGDVLIELSAPEMLAEVKRKEMLVEKALADVNAAKAEVGSVEARASALTARASLRTSELSRIKGLVNTGALTQAKSDEAQYALASVRSEELSMTADVKSAEAKLIAAEAGVSVARADLDYAKEMAKYLTIRAPFDGVVTRRSVDPGAYVRPPSSNSAMPLLELENIDKVRVVIMVPSSAAGGLSVGAPVLIEGIRGRSELKLNGKISRMSSGFERASRMMRAEVDFDNKADAAGDRVLRSGDYGSAVVTVASGL